MAITDQEKLCVCVRVCVEQTSGWVPMTFGSLTIKRVEVSWCEMRSGLTDSMKMAETMRRGDFQSINRTKRGVTE